MRASSKRYWLRQLLTAYRVMRRDTWAILLNFQMRTRHKLPATSLCLDRETAVRLEMADVLLDITVFKDLKAGDLDARKIVEGILDGEIRAAASPMTVCELWRSSEIDRRTEIGFLSVLRFVEEVTPVLEDARTAGLWLAGSEVEYGRRDPSCVAIAAATAKRLGIPICTRDAEAFASFDVEVTSY